MTNEPMNPDEPNDPNNEEAALPFDSDSELDETVVDSDSVIDDTLVGEPFRPEDSQLPSEDVSSDDVFSDDVFSDSVSTDYAADNDPFSSDTAGDYTAPPPPAGAEGYVAPARLSGLVRDPFASLGGIASGIAHRYSWDVTLVRLVFVIALFASFGSALFFYLIAWAVIPRATVWPPTAVRSPAGGFSNRDIGIGLAILGALTFTAVSGGSAGAVFVPLALVGGGVWLLTQAPRESDYIAAAPNPTMAGPTGGFTAPSAPAQSFATPPPPVSYNVPSRSGRRKWFWRIVLTIVGLIMLASIAGGILLASTGTFSDNGVQFNFGDREYGFERHSPDSLAELDRIVQLDGGYIELDLSDIPDSEWAALTAPINLDISIGEGELKLVVPDDLDFQLDAAVNRGSITETTEGRFGNVSRGQVVVGSGTSNELEIDNDSSAVDITVTVNDGDFELVTVDG